MEFREELAQFCAKTTDWPKTYDGLILVGTGQPITGALLIGRFTPQWVEYLLTEEMLQYPLDHQLQVKGIAALSRARCGPFW